MIVYNLFSLRFKTTKIKQKNLHFWFLFSPFLFHSFSFNIFPFSSLSSLLSLFTSPFHQNVHLYLFFSPFSFLSFLLSLFFSISVFLFLFFPQSHVSISVFLHRRFCVSPFVLTHFSFFPFVLDLIVSFRTSPSPFLSSSPYLFFFLPKQIQNFLRSFLEAGGSCLVFLNPPVICIKSRVLFLFARRHFSLFVRCFLFFATLHHYFS